jgi:hypothetical protein
MIATEEIPRFYGSPRFISMFPILLRVLIVSTQWPRDLRHDMSSPAQTLGSWVPITLDAWGSICFYSAFVLSCVGSGLATVYRLSIRIIISELILEGNRTDSPIRQDRRTITAYGYFLLHSCQALI